MSFWKPIIDWNASHKYHALNRTEAKWGIGIGLLRPARGTDGTPQGDVTPVSLPVVAPGDIHGAF